MSVLIDVAITTSAILLLGIGMMPLLKRRSAALRHSVLSSALVCAAAMPVIALAAPEWEPWIDLTPLAARTLSQHAIGTIVSAEVGRLQQDSSRSAALRSSTTATRLSPRALLIGVWAAGTIGWISMLLGGLARLSRISSRARRVTQGAWVDCVDTLRRDHHIHRRITLLETADHTLVITWGLRRPHVIVPVAAREWSHDRTHLVFSHELAHIRRRDWAIQLMAELARAMHWFNPLVWIACARLRRESEQACDDLLINGGVDASEYATHLVEVARELRPSPFWVPAPALVRRSTLERRVKAMLDNTLDRRSPSKLARAIALVSLLAASVAVAGLAAAQRFVSVTGTVVDPTNALLPGVKLVLTNEQSHAKYEIQSDSSGRYEFVGVPPGDYTLETSLPGFAVFQGKLNIVGQNVEQDLTLQLGTLNESITVTMQPASRPALSDAVLRKIEELRQKRAASTCPESAPGGTPRVGGNIRVPVKLKDVRPIYPESLRASETEGAVVLKGRIGTDGLLEDLIVVSSDHPDFANAALDAVKQWEFDATLLNCVAIDVPLNITVNFRR